MRPWGTISNRWFGSLSGLTSLAVCLTVLQAEEPLGHRRIWVPAGELAGVLERLSAPVELSPTEYETLVREVEAREGEAGVEPPREAVLRDLSMKGELREDVIVISAQYEWENLTGSKVSAPLPQPHPRLAALPEGDAAVEVRAATGDDGAAQVVLRDRGRFRMEARFHLPVTRPEDGFEVRLQPLPVAVASLRMRFEPGMDVTANAPVYLTSGGEHRFGMPVNGEGLIIRWRRSGNDAEAPVAVRQTSRNLYYLDESGLQADIGLSLRSELRAFPAELRFALPKETQVIDVSGEEVTHWTTEEGTLTLFVAAGATALVECRVLLERPALSAGEETATWELPMLRAAIATRAEGRLNLFVAAGIRFEGTTLPPWFLPSAPDVGSALESEPSCLAIVQFPDWNGKGPEIRVRRFVPRVHAEWESLVSVETDAVRLRHDVVIAPLEGEMFTSRVHLGAGEVLEEVEVTGSEGADWRSLGNEVRIQWRDGLTPGHPGRLRLRTKLHGDVWSQAKESARILVTGLRVEADSEEGYLAATASPDCRLSVRREEGVQGRDPRRLALGGQLAWQRTGASVLELEISRLRAAYDVHLTAFVVPDSRKLEIEGQVDLAVRRSALRELQFAVAPEVAGAMRFSSPLIASQWADLATGLVTVRFHHEVTGFQQLRWRMSLPVDPAQEGNEIRFAAALPKIDVPGADRLTGQWMIESMNDTSLTVKARQAKEFDSLRVPAISGYVPAFRVVAALDHRGAEHGIVVSGLQHVNRPVLGLVARRLVIDSYLSAEGREIHEAEFTLDNRAAGEVFVGIPGNGEILSLEVDGVPQRPVLAPSQESASGRRLRIVLARNGEIPVRLSYLQGGFPWGASGDLVVQPLRLDSALPVLETAWRVHLPEAYRCERFSGGLPPAFAEGPGILIPLLWERAAPVLEKSFGWAGTRPTVEPSVPSSSQGSQTLGGTATFVFHGWQAPDPLSFRYATSEEAIRTAWWWLAGGMIGFWVLGSFRPVVVGLTGAALLTFLPLSGLTDLISVANGLLAGWLVMFAGTQVWRSFTAWTRVMGPRELPAP